MKMSDTEKLKRLLEQLLGVCDRATPGPWKYREELVDELGSYGEVNSQADRKTLRARQPMVFERSWMEDGVFCCDARDYYPSSLKALQEILSYCLLCKDARVSPEEILSIIRKELKVDSDD